MRGDGRVFQRKGSSKFYVEYWQEGKQFREVGGRTEGEARRKLRSRIKELRSDRFIGPVEEKLSVTELVDNLEVHLDTRGAKAMASFRSHAKPLRHAFEFRRAAQLTTADIERYVASRLAEGKARATINRETGLLKQAFNLARKQQRLKRVPYVPSLREDNVRQGFFEVAEFEVVVKNLPEHIADVARFGYLTGWRKSEITGLTWDMVDRQAREIRLSTSKNGRGRVLPLDGELWNLIEKRFAARNVELPNGSTELTRLVFHKSGKSVGDFRKAWATACKKAGTPRLFHDLRRTAIRNMVRAGIPERVAMEISGHRTRAIFDRYNIVSNEDMRRALLQTQAHVESLPKTQNLPAQFPHNLPKKAAK